MKPIFFILFFILLAGCSLQPDYKRPKVDIPNNWREKSNRGSLALNKNWWLQFNDPVLTCLIKYALGNNKDLKIAVHRVKQAAADWSSVSSYLYPDLNLNALVNRFEISEIVTPMPPGGERLNNNYFPYLSLSWEIDIWQRVKNLNDAAFWEFMASIQNRRTILITVVSAVANSYFELRKLDAQLIVANETLRARIDALKIITLRFKAGEVSLVDVRQAQSEVESAQVVKTKIELQITITENRLRVLLGLNPGPISRGNTIDQLSKNIYVPTALPSDLLCQRPDIKEAEDKLIAAHAKLGAVKALYFPKIMLNGNYGFNSLHLNTLFTNPAETWSIGFSLFEPIFNAFRTYFQVKSAKEIEWQTLFNYLLIIQQAFKEVDDALITEIKTKELEKIEFAKVETDADYLRLATLRYDNGETDYLTVLDAERKLFDSQLQFIETQSNHLKSFVELFKTLGGGWVVDADCYMLNQEPMRVD
jgi:multidrug efflux system outer membrane protein